MSSREPPIAASPSAGLVAYANVSGFSRVLGIHSQTYKLTSQTLHRLNHLPGLWFFSLSRISFFSYILTMVGADHVTFLLCTYIVCLVLEGKTRPVTNSSRPPACEATLGFWLLGCLFWLLVSVLSTDESPLTRS